MSQGKVAVVFRGKNAVSYIPGSIFGVAGTDAIDPYLTGGVDRPAASGTRITAADPTTYTTTYLYLPPQPPSVTTQRKHNTNHQNRHHELAPKQEYLGQTWKETRIKTSPV